MTQDPPQPRAFDLRDYVEFDLDDPSGHRVLSTDVVALDVVCLEPGQTVRPRTFPTADAIYTVLGGRAWLVTDQDEVVLEPLQAALIPAGVPHAIRNNAADPLILQAVTSPPDEIPVVVRDEGQPSAEEGRGHAGRDRQSLVDRLRRGLGG